MNETELIASFERGDLDPARFDHEAHLRLAWAYLRREALPEAMIKMRDGLKKITTRLGAPEKYHETITFSFLLLLHERIVSTRPEMDFDTLIRTDPSLSRDWQRWMRTWYRPETLDSEGARAHFRLPDRLT